jgi:hypothetical protein
VFLGVMLGHKGQGIKEPYRGEKSGKIFDNGVT